MSKVFGLDDPGALDAVVAALQGGDPIVVPTDTVYGLAALPSSTDALAVLKGRPASMPIALLVDSLDQAAWVAIVSEVAARLARRFWPGPLTIVMEALAGGETVGVRCPDHDFIRTLAGRLGPLAVTSANRHGDATPIEARDAAATLAGDVAVIIDAGSCQGVPSTVVDAAGGQLSILRAGPITKEQIEAAALR